MSNDQGLINLTIEIDEKITLSDSNEKLEAFCSGCRKLSWMVTPQILALLAGLTEREIFRLIEAKLVHFEEIDRVLVCVDSVKEISMNSSTKE